MKKVLSLIMAGLLVMVMWAGLVWAKPGGNPGNSGKGGKQSKMSGTAADNKGKVSKPGREKNDARIDYVEVKNNKKSDKDSNKEGLEDGFTAGGPMFSDVRNNHWAAGSIVQMSALGLFGGYGDNSFAPDGNITQAELAELAARLVEATEAGEEEDINEDMEETEADEGETDEDTSENTGDELAGVPGWAKHAGQINLNRFHSGVQASRAETAVIIARAIGLDPVDASDLPFVDGMHITPEDAGYIMALYQEGLISGAPGGKFNPNHPVTRAELAALAGRILAGAEKETKEDIDEQAGGEDNAGRNN